MRKLFLTFLVFISLVTNSYATTVTFQNGVSSHVGKGCWVASWSSNEEATDVLYLRDFRDNLLWWDISSIPSNATVTSATLTINVTDVFTSDTIDVGSLSNPDASAIWNDMGSSGDNYNGAWATYSKKQYAGGIKWSVSGGSSSLADVINGPESSTSISTTGNKTFSVTNMVQGWVTTSSSNGGMYMVQENSSNIRAHSAWDANTAVRPLLTVNYTVPPSSHSAKIVGSAILKASKL